MKQELDYIRLFGIECEGHIGVSSAERTQPQRLLIDVALRLDLEAAGHADRLDLTLDYASVVEIVRQEVAGSRFKLVEALACHLIQPLLALPRVAEVTLEIHKFPADLEGQVREVALCLNRQNPASAN